MSPVDRVASVAFSQATRRAIDNSVASHHNRTAGMEPDGQETGIRGVVSVSSVYEQSSGCLPMLFAQSGGAVTSFSCVFLCVDLRPTVDTSPLSSAAANPLRTPRPAVCVSLR